MTIDDARIFIFDGRERWVGRGWRKRERWGGRGETDRHTNRDTGRQRVRQTDR